MITIRGTPIAKKRPRFARIGKFVRTYDCQETEEGKFLFELREQWRKLPLLSPIKITVRFKMPIPKGTSKKKTKLMESGEIFHVKKPDCDNLVKFLKDCCNGVVWRDDSQVYWIDAKKEYSREPRTEIMIDGFE